MSFMRWQLQRGVLAPADSDRPGSPWWRAVNERLLRDGCETVALSGDLGGRPSSRTVEQWMSFADEPNARAWYRAHNGSVVAAYLEYRELRPLAPVLGDPRLGMAGIFLQLSRILPDEYPLRDEVRSYLSDELGFGRLLDFGLIVPRVQELYQWSAHELGAPGLLDCARERALTYAWPFEDRDVWVARRSITVAMVRRAIPAARGPRR